MKSPALVLLTLLCPALVWVTYDLGIRARPLVVPSVTAFAISDSRRPASDASIKTLWRKVGKNPRKMLSSNVNHYWAWMKENAELHLDSSLLIDGVVIGDPHLKNVLDIENNLNKRQLSVVDLDDGGRAPLLLDAVRLMTILKVSDLRFKYREMYEAYLAGLGGQVADVPDEVARALTTTHKTTEDDRLRYLAKKTQGHRFLYDKLELKSSAQMTRAQKTELRAALKASKEFFKMQNWEAVDYGVRINDSGSSMGLERYWVLVQKDGQLDQIIEFKKMAKPATEFYQEQLNTSDRTDEIRAVYGENLSLQFQLINAGDLSFWMRPRHSNLVDLDRDPFDKDSFQHQWGLYLCNWLGQKQRLMEVGRDLLKRIQKNDDIKSKLEDLSRAYIDEVTSYD
jgi:hypothetical protein